MLTIATATSCSTESRPPPRGPRAAVVEEPAAIETTTPTRITLTSVRGAVLYIPTSFSAKNGGYDLVIHFHGLSKLQEANIERAQLDVAVVSINLGAGTAPYAKAFARKETFEHVLAEAQSEIERSGHAPNAHLRRLALTAWSAGSVSVERVMKDPAVAERVDAVLLADGFFTSFTNVKKRIVNAQALEPFARYAEAAERDEKLFAITHTSIPTGKFPSVQECVATLLDMIHVPKMPSSATGPRDMHEIYTVDRGSFHVHAYDGTTATDHVNQIRAMGVTLFPYLKARWDKQDADASAKRDPTSGAAARSSP